MSLDFPGKRWLKLQTLILAGGLLTGSLRDASGQSAEQNAAQKLYDLRHGKATPPIAVTATPPASTTGQKTSLPYPSPGIEVAPLPTGSVAPLSPPAQLPAAPTSVNQASVKKPDDEPGVDYIGHMGIHYQNRSIPNAGIQNESFVGVNAKVFLRKRKSLQGRIGISPVIEGELNQQLYSYSWANQYPSFYGSSSSAGAYVYSLQRGGYAKAGVRAETKIGPAIVSAEAKARQPFWYSGYFGTGGELAIAATINTMTVYNQNTRERRLHPEKTKKGNLALSLEFSNSLQSVVDPASWGFGKPYRTLESGTEVRLKAILTAALTP